MWHFTPSPTRDCQRRRSGPSRQACCLHMSRPTALHALVLSGACALAASACQKHDDPIGTVPSDDIRVPAVAAPDSAPAPATPTHDPLQTGTVPHPDCETLTGTEYDNCLRGNPPPALPPEPQQSPPPTQQP